MTDNGQPALGVGMVGYAFMGAAHSQAWRTAGRFFDLPLGPGHGGARRARRRRRSRPRRPGSAGPSAETDWRELVARDDIDLVDICTPGDSHAEIAIAALEAGKHVLCEKPLANTVAEAEAMTAAAERGAAHGVRSMVGFNYRRVPARRAGPASWSRRAGSARSGTCGRSTCRTGSSTRSSRWSGGCRRTRPAPARWATSARTSSTWPSSSPASRSPGCPALTETFVKERPLPSRRRAGCVGHGRRRRPGPVTVDDAALFTARFSGGALGTFEATRFATGRKNALRHRGQRLARAASRSTSSR